MIPLAQCDGCRRHVRVTESRCPFCDAPRAPSDASEVFASPRGLSRAVLIALGASLTGGACQGRTSGPAQPVAAHPVTAQPVDPPHPVIAAPYGLPPPPEEVRRGPEPAWFITLSDPISLRACATTPMVVRAQNSYDAPVLTHRERVVMKVNGAIASAFNRVFQETAAGPGWDSIPAHGSVRDERVMLGALITAPGEYFFELYLDDRRIAGRRISVTP